MSTLDFKGELWERIMELRPRKKVNDSLISIRCPFCGDSRKHTDSTHFYVKINMREDTPVLFMCHRCDTSGILTPSILRSMDINDLNINSGLVSYNKAATKNMNQQIGTHDNSLNFKVPIADANDERNIFKKEYFEGRLGIQTTFEELADLKVILKLGQFMKLNNVLKLTTYKEKGESLHNDYLGFLSIRNEFINFRQVYESKFLRYEKYPIVGGLDNTRKFYTIPNEIDLLSPKRITLNISEGSFDILGVYYHIYEQAKENMIYAAACGSGYESVIKYFISMGVFDNVDVNIYSDDDRDPSFYRQMVKSLKPWVNEFNLFYNDKSKDFGVPKDKIKVVKKRIG
jgi:hypothetical protein